MVTHVTHVITANSPEQHQPKKKPSHIDTSKVLNPQINGCTSVESDSEELLMVPPVGRPVCVCVCVKPCLQGLLPTNCTTKKGVGEDM